ncbi:MAG: hypothetical protein U0165_07750 [Polyangiaceae bacterium]
MMAAHRAPPGSSTRGRQPHRGADLFDPFGDGFGPHHPPPPPALVIEFVPHVASGLSEEARRSMVSGGVTDERCR